MERRPKKLATDVIIRDMRRVDGYPDADAKRKGVSPWFRAGLMGTYHRGVLIGLRWETLTATPDSQWRFTRHNDGEKGDVNVVLIGHVPYENIESVDWDGDEYYGLPHIYCHFDARRKEPYEKLAFCEKRELDDIPFYKEVALYKDVLKRSKPFGLKHSV